MRASSRRSRTRNSISPESRSGAASVLVLVNTVTINITSLGVRWYKGHRPDDWFQQGEARVVTEKRAVVLAVVLVLSAFLGAVTYDTYRTGRYEETVTDEIDAVLASPATAERTLIDVTVSTPIRSRCASRTASSSGSLVDAHRPEVVYYIPRG